MNAIQPAWPWALLQAVAYFLDLGLNGWHARCEPMSKANVFLLCLVTLAAPALPARVRCPVSADQFVIMAWGQAPPDARLLKGMADCGFNLAGFAAPADLDAVHRAGLQAIVSAEATSGYDFSQTLDPLDVERRVNAFARRVGRHPALFGFYLQDEPPARHFAGLARVAAALQKAAPGKLPYINLFPDYATAEQLGSENYALYVEEFLHLVHPPFLSFDHYALFEDGTLRPSFFSNLEVIRSAGLKQAIPFWAIILGNCHFTYAEPSDAGLRFQVYSALAYGARGICYFTYFTPDIGNYRLAAIDAHGNKTETWTKLRRLNLEIQALAPVLKNLKSIGVFHTEPLPAGTAGLAASRWLLGVAGGSGAFVVGEFVDFGGPTLSAAGQPRPDPFLPVHAGVENGTAESLPGITGFRS